MLDAPPSSELAYQLIDNDVSPHWTRATQRLLHNPRCWRSCRAESFPRTVMLLWVLGLTHRVRADRSPRRRLIDRLVAARKAAGLTQVVLTGKLAKPQQFVSRYEVGDRRLDIVEYVYVARALNVDPVAEVALCAPTKNI